jgi:hypothetical protein
MSEEIRFEPGPGVAFLSSDTPTEIVEVVVRHCPPGTPAPPREDRPHLSKKRPPSEQGPEGQGSTRL